MKQPVPRSERVELVGFVAGQARRNGEKLKPGELPTEFVIPLGNMDAGARGRVIVNEQTLRGFRAFQAANRLDHVMLDFNHNTLPGSKAPEPRLKAAKLRPEVVEGVGIVCRVEYWTPEGEQAAKGGHFPDISPAVWRNKAGVVQGLHSVALCEHGEVKHDCLEIFSADIAGLSNQTNQRTDMDYKLMLCKLLGLAPEASDEEISAAIAKAGTGGGAAPEGMSAKHDAGLAAFMARLEGFEAKIATLEKKGEGAQIDGFIAAAVAQGKSIKLDRETLVGFGAKNAQVYLDSLTAGAVTTTPGAQQGNENAKGAKKGDAGLGLEGFTAESLKVLTDAGISVDDAKRALREQAALNGGKAEAEGDDDEATA